MKIYSGRGRRPLRVASVWLLALLLLLTGCRRQHHAVQSNVITQITITCQTEEGLLQRHYTSQDKMRSVLLYIRSIRSPFSANEEPGEGSGAQVSITTVSADKTTKTYRQQGQSYFREGDGKWKTIDPEKGANLWRIIKLLPSDEDQLTVDSGQFREVENGFIRSADLLPRPGRAAFIMRPSAQPEEVPLGRRIPFFVGEGLAPPAT